MRLTPMRSTSSEEMPETPIDKAASVIYRCTSCGELAIFHYIGTQHWPKAIVEGRPDRKPSLTLWTCSVCSTTLSDLK